MPRQLFPLCQPVNAGELFAPCLIKPRLDCIIVILPALLAQQHVHFQRTVDVRRIPRCLELWQAAFDIQNQPWAKELFQRICIGLGCRMCQP